MAALEGTTAHFRDLARRYGGHADVVSTVARRASRLGTVTASDPVHARLGAALVELHTLAGWCCYDARDDSNAQRHYRVAADLATDRNDKTALADVLQYVGILDRAAGRPNDALKLYQLAGYRLDFDAALTRVGHGLAALAYADMGHQEHARSELGRARDGWKPAGDGDEADMNYQTALVAVQLGRHEQAERFAAAVNGDGRFRPVGALARIVRAQVHVTTGELDASSLARSAIGEAAGLRSRRARQRLAPLADALDVRRQPELARQAREVVSGWV